MNRAIIIIRIGKENQEDYRQVFLLGLTVCLHPIHRYHDLNEIRLDKRVFIITLDIIKLQKYPYNLNVPYRIVAPHTKPIISPLTKRRCLKDSVAALL